MGNRAVITTARDWNEWLTEGKGVGVYLHWNGGRDSVEPFLEYCKLRLFRSPVNDPAYGYARLSQVIANFMDGSLSIGVGYIKNMDPDGENGVYIIGGDSGWDIVDRINFDGKQEQANYDFTETLLDIDKSQPKESRLGRNYIRAKWIPTSKLRKGDKVFIHKPIYEHPAQHTVMGIVNGIPYINYGSYTGDDWGYVGVPANALREPAYKAVKRRKH